jgi:chromosome segregation ATPase
VIQRPLIETLSRSGGMQTGELDPDTVAAALGFGRVSQPATPLSENPTPARRVANTSEISLIDTRAKKPEAKPSLFSLVMDRLDSLTPLSVEHAKLVTEMKARVIPQLTKIDSFISEIEEARYIAISTRWESIRVAGRKLIDSLPELQRQLAEAQQYCNQSESVKVRTQKAAEQLFHERVAMGKSPWLSTAELKSADQKLEKAKELAIQARQKALEDVKRMAVVESKIASIHATVESYQTELHVLSLELSGEAHFDPEFGLSTEPRFYKEQRATIGG